MVEETSLVFAGTETELLISTQLVVNPATDKADMTMSTKILRIGIKFKPLPV